MADVSVSDVKRSFDEGGRIREVLRGLSFDVAGGELCALARPQRLGQIDAAQPDRRHRPPRRRTHRHRRLRGLGAGRARAHAVSPGADRLRLPVLQPDLHADGRGERPPAARARRRAGRQRARRGAAAAPGGRARRPRRGVPRPPVGRRAAAGGDRPRAGQRAGGGAGRRADRRARRRDRTPGPGHVRRAVAPAGDDGDPGDPQRRGRARRRPRAGDEGRPDRAATGRHRRGASPARSPVHAPRA